MTLDKYFVGRSKEIERLREAYRERRHVLLVGSAGIGKTALLRQMQNQLRLVFCEETSSLRRICESLERHLGWTHRNMNVVERKNRLLPYLARRAEPVALDSVALTPPRVARFIYQLMERVPVWIACRSTQPKDIGAVWQHLYGFQAVRLAPIAPSETAVLVQSAVNCGRVPVSAKAHTPALHRLSRGNPRALEELLIELSSREYRLDALFGRKLLELDQRIHSMTTLITAQMDGC
jgi:predicted ATPase